MRVVRDVSVVDPEMAAQRAANEARTASAFRVLAEQLDARDVLRVPVDEAVDILCALWSPRFDGYLVGPARAHRQVSRRSDGQAYIVAGACRRSAFMDPERSVRTGSGRTPATSGWTSAHRWSCRGPKRLGNVVTGTRRKPPPRCRPRAGPGRRPTWRRDARQRRADARDEGRDRRVGGDHRRDTLNRRSATQHGEQVFDDRGHPIAGGRQVLARIHDGAVAEGVADGGGELDVQDRSDVDLDDAGADRGP